MLKQIAVSTLIGIVWLCLAAGGVAQPVFGAEAYLAKWVAQSDTVSLKAGERASVWVEIQNTGTATWANSGDSAVKVGRVRRRDRSRALYSISWLSNNRAASA